MKKVNSAVKPALPIVRIFKNRLDFLAPPQRRAAIAMHLLRVALRDRGYKKIVSIFFIKKSSRFLAPPQRRAAIAMHLLRVALRDRGYKKIELLPGPPHRPPPL